VKRPAFCPWCGGGLVWDSGLFHCDNPNDVGGSEGCGAWDPENAHDEHGEPWTIVAVEV
jgi:hypothetical protein